MTDHHHASGRPAARRASSLLGLLLAAVFLPHGSVLAQSTWNGTVSAYWTNVANWSPDIPATGGDVVIADTTANNLILTDPVTIGSLLFGDTGNRNTAFTIRDSVASRSLTLTNGFAAYGAGGALATKEFFYVPIIIANDQTWTIGGSAGSASADAGIRLRERSSGVPNTLTLNGTLTKAGSGQLSFVGQNVGNGNVVVQQGSLKLNAGGSTLLTVGGTGSITVSNGASLMISRNSGTFNFTKAVVLTPGATIQFGGGNTTLYPFPITMDGNITLSSANATDNSTTTALLSGDWSGTAAITTANVNAASRVLFYILSNNIAGWTGSLNNAGNGVRVGFAAPAPGNAAVAWSLNNAGAILETYGAPNVQLGSLGGNSGTLRNSDPVNQPATVTVGALNTSTTFGGMIADNAASLGLVKIGSGTLTLSGDNTFSGGTIVSNGAVMLLGTTAALGSGSVEVRSGASVGGSGTASGTVTVDSGGMLRATGGVGAPPLNVGALTLGTGSADSTSSFMDVYAGGKIVCSGAFTVNGSHTINLVGGVPAVGVYDLITYIGAIGGDGFAGFKLGSVQPGVVANLVNSGGAVQLNVTATGESGRWAGNVLSQWNLAGGLEWKGATSGNPQAYLDLYPVFFDDSAASFAVSLTENVTPASVSVNNTTAYTFSGVGGIVGSGSLMKDGPGTLTIVNSNSYSGGTFITNGTVQLGDGGASGDMPGNVVNDGVVVFNRSDAVALNSISGSGSVEQRGTGRVTVGGVNSYLGAATIASGTFAAGSGSALGDTNTGTVVMDGATLDVNVQNLGMEPITAQGAGVGGGGAIVNNGTGDQQNATRYVTLSGDTTFGGARRWDVRNPSAATDLTGGINAYLHGSGFSLTKVGTNVVAFISAGDTALGDIDIQGGTLTFSRSTTMGNSTRRATVWPGATLQVHRLNEYMVNPLDKVISMTNATFAVEGNGLTNDCNGPVTLTGSNLFNLPSATGLNLHGAVGGTGSLNVAGPGLLVISGTANHSGGTTVSGAALQVEGTLGTGTAPLEISGTSTLAGNGTILAPVTIPSGATLSPGGSIGALTISSSLTLADGSSSLFEIDKDTINNDAVRGLTSVTYGGTLIVSNIGYTAYAPGDSFKLFNAGSYSGKFANVVPATPALGLIWVTSSLAVNGTLGVAVLPNPIPLYVYSASSLVTNKVNVVFSAEVDPAYATDPGNYVLSTGNQVLSAMLISTTNVVLELDSPITSPTFTVNVKNVRDFAYVPNIVATTNVPGLAIGFEDSSSISITNGSAFAYGTNSQIKVYADGSDIFSTEDHCQYVYKYVTGDFDLRVMIESFVITDPAAKAGIMAREMVDPTYVFFDDRNYMAASFSPDPSRNNNFVQYREGNGLTTVAPGSPRPAASYPHNWLRLKRAGSVLMGYCGSNGLDWTPMTFVDSSTNAAGPYPDTIRVGLAVTSHNAAQTTEVVFSQFGNVAERGVISISWTGSQVRIDWTNGTLQQADTVTGPYVDVAGATSPLEFLPSEEKKFYRLRQ